MRWLIREIRIFTIGLALFAFGTLVVAGGVYLGIASLQHSQDEEVRTRYIEVQSLVHQETEGLKQEISSIRDDLNMLIESQRTMSNSIIEIQQSKPSLEKRIDAVESQLAALAKQVNLDVARRRQASLDLARTRTDELHQTLRDIRQQEIRQQERIQRLQTPRPQTPSPREPEA